MESGNQPYQFALSTDDFFRRFVTVGLDGLVVQPYGVAAQSPVQQSAIPSKVQQVVQLDDGRAVVILDSNPAWVKSSGLKAGIMLINQDGKWLINQLVLVKDE